jgi:hypothetical protein
MLQEIYSEPSRVRNIGIDAVRQSSCIFIRLNSTHPQQHVHRFKNAVLRHVCTIDCDAVDVDRLADQLDMCSMRTLLACLGSLACAVLGATRRAVEPQCSRRSPPAARLSPATFNNLTTPSEGC